MKKQNFIVPNQEKRKKALDINYTSKILKAQFSTIQSHFQVINEPKPGDWLYEHPGEGQTFQAYQNNSHNVVNKQRNVIYLKPLDDAIPEVFLNDLKQYCQCFYYPLKVKVLKPQNILKNIKKRMNDGVLQIHAGQALQKLKPSLRQDGFCLIGISVIDLYPRQSWNYVFGLASLQGRTGIFSFARYDNRFYQQNGPYQIDYQKILWKSIATMVHQIGHMFGIKHCIYYQCIMNGSNGPHQTGKKPMQLCSICLKKLQSNIKFDIVQRYNKILQFLKQKRNKGDKRKEQLIIKISQILNELSQLKVQQKKLQPYYSVQKNKQGQNIRQKSIKKIKIMPKQIITSVKNKK